MFPWQLRGRAVEVWRLPNYMPGLLSKPFQRKWSSVPVYWTSWRRPSRPFQSLQWKGAIHVRSVRVCHLYKGKSRAWTHHLSWTLELESRIELELEDYWLRISLFLLKIWTARHPIYGVCMYAICTKADPGPECATQMLWLNDVNTTSSICQLQQHPMRRTWGRSSRSSL